MAAKPHRAPRGRRAPAALAAAEAALRSHALAKPSATEHFPWGERAIKVNGKVFLFMYADGTRLSLSTKLPASNGVALMLPFAKPTGYGLGKAGWVSANFETHDEPPLDMLCAWIDESYEAVAPRKLAALVRGDASAVPAQAEAPRRRAAKAAVKAAATPAPRTAAASAARTKPPPRTAATSAARTKPPPRTAATSAARTKPPPRTAATSAWRARPARR